MSHQKGKVLIVEDEDVFARVYESRLSREGYELARATDVEGGLTLLISFHPDVVVLDLMLQQQDIEEGFSILQDVVQSHPDTKVIVLTSHGKTPVADRALQLGAYDFIDKGNRGYSELTFRVNQAYDRHQIEQRIKDLKLAEIQRVSGYRYGRNGIIVGTSEPMSRLYHQIDRVASTDATILIRGENGTGKELVAEAIHALSPRSNQRMVTVNCGAIPAELIESELFGYVRGSHSAALQNRSGLFEAADGSTLFLDEIGEIPLDLQVKLLRGIDKREIRRVGDTHTIPVDLRVIAATNKDLETAINNNEFREDLYFRLNQVSLHVPPLRDREGDLRLLATHFLEQCNERYSRRISGFTEAAIAFLENQEWPGNVRELENTIHRAVLFATGDWIGPDDLEMPRTPQRESRRHSLTRQLSEYANAVKRGEEISLSRLVAECEAAFIRQALSKSRSQQEAAQKLGITESGLRSKMDKYDIPRVRKRSIRK